MCVAILQPAGEILSNTRFDRCWKRNKDGGGFAYPDKNGNVIVSKGYFDPKQMRKAYRGAVKANPDVPFMIHFRIATSGRLDEENTHPFLIRDDLAVCHNGHISGWGNKILSDTRQFVLKVLTGLPEGFHRDPVMQELVRGYISSDKMVMLDAEGKWVILNEKLGVWDNNLWFSNTSFRKPKTYTHSSWSGKGSKLWAGWDKPASYIKGEVLEAEKYEYTGMPCELCSTPLGEEDDEFCLDCAALFPCCLECLEHFGINQLIQDGILQWYDERYDDDTYEIAATSADEEDKPKFPWD